jgi:site-specific recombinase XerD
VASGEVGGRTLTSSASHGSHAAEHRGLRPAFDTRIAAAGVPLRTIQHWMGHADAKTTQVYAH